MSHTIPILSASPTWEQAVAYLRWLDRSPYCYNLDDDATDMGFPVAIGEALAANANALMDTFGRRDVIAEMMDVGEEAE